MTYEEIRVETIKREKLIIERGGMDRLRRYKSCLFCIKAGVACRSDELLCKNCPVKNKCSELGSSNPGGWWSEFIIKYLSDKRVIKRLRKLDEEED
jgi:hypothetical protein